MPRNMKSPAIHNYLRASFLRVVVVVVVANENAIIINMKWREMQDCVGGTHAVEDRRRRWLQILRSWNLKALWKKGLRASFWVMFCSTHQLPPLTTRFAMNMQWTAMMKRPEVLAHLSQRFSVCSAQTDNSRSVLQWMKRNAETISSSTMVAAPELGWVRSKTAATWLFTSNFC